MKKVIKSVWWRVLATHLAILMLWYGGINQLGISVLILLICSLISYCLGSQQSLQPALSSPVEKRKERVPFANPTPKKSKPEINPHWFRG